MATKDENKLVGNEMQKKYKVRLSKKGKVLEEVDKKHDGDAEAGVDPQEEQLNDMPNNPTDMPLEKKKTQRDKNKTS